MGSQDEDGWRSAREDERESESEGEGSDESESEDAGENNDGEDEDANASEDESENAGEGEDAGEGEGEDEDEDQGEDEGEDQGEDADENADEGDGEDQGEDENAGEGKDEDEHEPRSKAKTQSKKKAPLARWRVWLRRILRFFGLVMVLVLGFSLVVVIDGWEAIGKAPNGARWLAMQESPQWVGDVFQNPQPLWNDELGMVTASMDPEPNGSPDEPLPVEDVPAERFDHLPESGLRITWLGHSTLLIEVDGHRFLTDPVWGERTSPVRWLGPERWYAPPLALGDVPEVDAVLISHDHYDHLDHPTIVAMKDWDTLFVVPLGVGAHLEYWGVPLDRIVELDWWDRFTFPSEPGHEPLTLVMTPSRHASGRQVLDQNRTLWAGYALIGAQHRVYFSGDTGLFPAMREIGERYGPFDVAMLEVGAYAQQWPDWHLGPEQAVTGTQWVQGQVLLPIHWGLFNLAMHGWTEPIERTLVAAEKAEVPVVAPRPGESFELSPRPEVRHWWPDLPWRTAEEYPIEARGLD